MPECIFCMEHTNDPHHLLVCESMCVQEARGGKVAQIVLCNINFEKCKRRLTKVKFRPEGYLIF